VAVDLRAFNHAFATLLKDQTSAGPKVSPGAGVVVGRGYPQITFDIIGESPWEGYTPGTNTRIALRCHAERLDDSRKLYSEVRDILLPVTSTAYGYYGDVTVTPAGMGTVTVRFSGIQHNAGPNALQDLPTGTPMLESYWLVPHYQA
jgi:hypothetical protein